MQMPHGSGRATTLDLDMQARADLPDKVQLRPLTHTSQVPACPPARTHARPPQRL
jgi:hypothetical protein